jgi:basic amino acid/polyamine antiporter, APA family
VLSSAAFCQFRLPGEDVDFVRSIGRWALAGLVINCIIGSGIFGIPSELIKRLGRASPLAMIAAGLAMATIMACYAEVASQFTEPGGSYLYVRTAFGRFAGLQIGWFWLLSILGGAAANANLFITYLAGMAPQTAHGWARAAILTGLIAIPVAANYRGARAGANVSSALTVAKLAPLAILIALGLWHFGHAVQIIHPAEITSPGWKPWAEALLLVSFAYEGFEDAVVPAAEMKNPRRSVPFAIFTGLIVCMAAYTLLQFITAATIGTRATDRPLGDVAAVLLGPGGLTFVGIAVMLSAYGYISAAILNAPRLASAFAENGDGPQWLGKLHPRFHTPFVAIVVFGALLWILALTGTFLWALAIAVGASTIYYAGVCASLIRLRRTRPRADALRIPWGTVWAVAGIAFSLLLLTQMDAREGLLMLVTAAIAAANWWWAKRKAGGSLDEFAEQAKTPHS